MNGGDGLRRKFGRLRGYRAETRDIDREQGKNAQTFH